MHDVVVIGAGVVGACCARACAEAGLSVIVVDRGAVASGTTGGGEGNILVSDKEPGPELDLALLSRDLWAQMAGALGDSFELDPKGGLVVAARPQTYEHLLRFADEQRACGVMAETVAAADLAKLEPRISRDLVGGVFYPQDMQVQPMMAAAHLIEAARATGRATLMTDCTVTGIDRDASGAISSVRTAQGVISTRHVINAAGTWGGERVGFDQTVDWQVVGRLARQAIEIFPFLADVQLLRTYGGFRPYCPDHLPVVGRDPRVPGLFHACGHEGAGVGLAAATGHVIAQSIAGEPTSVDLAPFSAARFEVEHVV